MTAGWLATCSRCPTAGSSIGTRSERINCPLAWSGTAGWGAGFTRVSLDQGNMDQATGLRRRFGRQAMATALLIAAAAPAPGRADEGQRLSAIEENDSLFFDSDKHYTQGLRL